MSAMVSPVHNNLHIGLVTHGLIASVDPVAQQIELEPVYLRPLVEEVVGLIRPLVSEEVLLSNQLPDTLPPVMANRTKLAQIFFNLIGNASRFTHVSHSGIVYHALMH